jgi:predicted nucleic acid-binding protein
MIVAVDTNIFLDVLIPDEDHFERSKRMLDEYVKRGQLIVCEIVYAELASQFSSEHDLRTFLSDTGIRLIQSSQEAVYLAGERWKEYSKNKNQRLQCPQCGKKVTTHCPQCGRPLTFRQHIISDFMIGAHALTHAELFLTRDRGFYRTYFKDLRIA